MIFSVGKIIPGTPPIVFAFSSSDHCAKLSEANDLRCPSFANPARDVALLFLTRVDLPGVFFCDFYVGRPMIAFFPPCEFPF